MKRSSFLLLVAPVDRYTSLGCWKDKTNRAIKGYEGVLGIDGCYERAKSKHFDTFAVQSGGQCFTSPTASDTYRIYGPSKGCSSDGTGGTWSQEVYKIGIIIIVWSILLYANKYRKGFSKISYNVIY